MLWKRKSHQDVSAAAFMLHEAESAETYNENKVADLVFTRLPKLEIPDVPLELLYRPYKVLRGLFSTHTRDLTVILIVLTVIIIWVTVYLTGYFVGFDTPGILKSHAPSVFAGATAAWAGLFFTVYQAGKKRLAIVDIINSEIIVISRIFAFTNTVGSIADLLETFSKDSDTEINAILQNSAVGRRVRSESYFEFFHNNPHDLGALDSDIVDHVTYFYTFFKAARDEANDLASHLAGIKENYENGRTNKNMRHKEIQRILVNLLYLLDVMMLTANRALVKMVSSGTHRAYTSQLTLAQGIRANTVLCTHFLKNADGLCYDRRLLQALGRRVVYSQMVKDWNDDRRKAPLIQEMERAIVKK